MKERKDTWFEKGVTFVRDFYTHLKIKEPEYQEKTKKWIEIK